VARFTLPIGTRPHGEESADQLHGDVDERLLVEWVRASNNVSKPNVENVVNPAIGPTNTNSRQGLSFNRGP
jgi:hypothetical protein